MLLIVLGLLTLGVAPAFAFTDNFNRENANNLGPNWTQKVGTMGIEGNQAASWEQYPNYATVNGFSQNYLSTQVSVDAIDINGGLAYVALMFGIASDSQSIFVKVQDQGGNGSFNYYAFYYGNNGGGGKFHLLDTPFDKGRITAWASDVDTFWLGIDSNFDGIYEQTYSYTGWSGYTFGTGVGLGMYGNVRADNFSTEGGGQQVPEPLTALLLGIGLVGIVGSRRRLTR